MLQKVWLKTKQINFICLQADILSRSLHNSLKLKEIGQENHVKIEDYEHHNNMFSNLINKYGYFYENKLNYSKILLWSYIIGIWWIKQNADNIYK